MNISLKRSGSLPSLSLQLGSGLKEEFDGREWRMGMVGQ